MDLTKLKYITKPNSEFKSDWERNQSNSNFNNPQFFLKLDADANVNPWKSIQQKEHAVLSKHIPGLPMGQNARFKNKKQINDELRNQRILQTKLAFENYK
jgi:hypothetical protein